MIHDKKAPYLRVAGLAGLLGFALVGCGAGAGGESTGLSRQAIVGGTEAGVSGSPMLYLEGPQGTCSAVLIAPNLVATARHCTAELGDGTVTCTPEGDLMPTGSGAGEIGADDPPGSLSFYSAERVAAGGTSSAPDAVGVMILSTQAASICCDDLAFVILDRAMEGLVPAPIRIDRPTQVGEAVSVFGYGLTDRSMEPTALRVRADAQIMGVGPEDPTSVPQAAPLRALRIGPGVVTCNGDSGGPVISVASGAVVGLVSLGSQASTGPFCSPGPTADTTGPDLADYRDLALAAFQAAGASPILERLAPPDAGTPDAGAAPDAPAGPPDAAAGRPDAGTPVRGGGRPPPSPIEFVATGGSCAMIKLDPGERSSPAGAIACGLAMMTVAAGRRRR